MSDISELVGLTLTACESRDDEVYFTVSDGRVAELYHWQDCCEVVTLEEVIGDLSDLVGEPILVAEERTSSDEPAKDEYAESHTWTFYELRTIKGSVTLRWYGTSNGYYSEGVDFDWGKPDWGKPDWGKPDWGKP